ncbi:MAG TPA: hypothetical protein EYG89_04760 [Bacteroidia bacterium]|nr:hypothetical protein [Bacteroidia bacterium]
MKLLIAISIIISSLHSMSLDELLHEAQKGDMNASRELGLKLIYEEEECKKGVSFLIIASSENLDAILDLAKLFKDEVCFKKSELKYNKYINIYYSFKNAN